ncbi:helix-turn-helix transcriptional regulator [Agrobacterium tumefaciens]|nr:helix-turn-helix transcriptional regulator [Agrobacterium tumefaciens]
MADGGRTNSDISMRLAALMAALEKKQVDFAALIGISQPALNNYLKGLRRPDIDVAIAIQSKTGATLDWIYLGDRSGLPLRLASVLPDLSAQAAEKSG